MNDWNETFRKAIRDSGLTLYMVAKRAEIPVSILQRFMEKKPKEQSKRKTLTLDTAAKLAGVVGLELKAADKTKSGK